MPSGKVRDQIKKQSLISGLHEQALLMEKNAHLMTELVPDFVDCGHPKELIGAAKITRDWKAEIEIQLKDKFL